MSSKEDFYFFIYYFTYIPIIGIFFHYVKNYERPAVNINSAFLLAFYLMIVWSVMLNYIKHAESKYIIGTTWGFGNFSNLLALTSFFILPSLTFSLRTRKIFSLIVRLIPLIVSLAIILHNGTRAALIIMFCGLVYVLIEIRGPIKSGKLFLTIILTAVIILFTVFNQKKESNEGRLLVYKVCVSEYLRKEYFFKGVGFNKFKADYPLKFLSYIGKNPIDPKFKDNISNTFFAFNDFFQLLIEIGIFGGVLVIIIFFYLIKSIYLLIPIKKDRQFMCVYWGLFVFLASIHYPFRVFEIMRLFIITSILALVKIKTGSLVELKNRLFIFFIVTSSVLIFSFNGLYIYLMIKVKSIEVINLKFNESEDYYKKFTFLLDG